MPHRAIIENVVPAITYIFNRRTVYKRLQEASCDIPDVVEYSSLDSDTLSRRLAEEHVRAVKIDEKTFKFTLGLSVSLTIIAAASGSFAKFLPIDGVGELISVMCGVSALYMLSAGIISLGALKTLPAFGYGTHHEVELKSDGVQCLALALWRQEKINVIRHLRNEAAYQSLRNGFLVLFVGLLLALAVLINSMHFGRSDIPINSSSVENVGVVEVSKSTESEGTKKNSVIPNTERSGK